MLGTWDVSSGSSAGELCVSNKLLGAELQGVGLPAIPGPRPSPSPGDFIRAVLLCRQKRHPETQGCQNCTALRLTHAWDWAVTMELWQGGLKKPACCLSPGVHSSQKSSSGSPEVLAQVLIAAGSFPTTGLSLSYSPSPCLEAGPCTRVPTLCPSYTQDCPCHHHGARWTVTSSLGHLSCVKGTLLPTTSVPHMDTGSCPGRSISNPAPC